MIFLKKLKEEDLELVLKWKRNESYLNKEHNLTIESQKKWLYNIEKNENCRYWIINSGSIKIGIVDINHIDSDDKSCNLECIIEDKHFRNRGIAHIVLFNLLEYVYNEINMNKVYISVSENNNPFNEDEFLQSIVEESNIVFTDSEEFFGHKYICLKKLDWQLMRDIYLSERINID